MEPVPGRLPPGGNRGHLEIDRLGRNLRDLVGIVGIVGIVGERQVGVKSLTIGIVDAVTARGALVFGMFVLLAE
jgi:DNA invertase Pin-like site-specific DNA recombinase